MRADFILYPWGKPKPRKIHSPRCAACGHRHDDHNGGACAGPVWLRPGILATGCDCAGFVVVKEDGA